MKKAFTLVEMLIVIIIIGILMAALLPRLKGAQERARDTARKANLSQISTALEMYFNDNGTYPWWDCVSDIRKYLVPSYMNSIPTDPQKWRIVYGTKVGWCPGGVYWYSDLTKNGATSWWSVLVANIEAFGKVGNWVLTGNTDYKNKVELDWTTEYVNNLDKKICDDGVVYTGTNTNIQCSSSNKLGAAHDNPALVYVRFN